MRIPGGNLLAALRLRRHRVIAALSPALLLSFVTGSSCLAMTMGHDMGARASAAPLQSATMEHMAHHDAPEPKPAPTPGKPTCPHCQTADQPTEASHSACGAADVSDVGATLAKHSATDVKVLVPSGWAPLGQAPAPPLIRAAAPPVSVASSVPLNIRHCVLLI